MYWKASGLEHENGPGVLKFSGPTPVPLEHCSVIFVGPANAIMPSVSFRSLPRLFFFGSEFASLWSDFSLDDITDSEFLYL